MPADPIEANGGRLIVHAWVNVDDTLRACGARDDAYAVFRRMLEAGDPPVAWNALVAAARPDQGEAVEPSEK